MNNQNSNLFTKSYTKILTVSISFQSSELYNLKLILQTWTSPLHLFRSILIPFQTVLALGIWIETSQFRNQTLISKQFNSIQNCKKKNELKSKKPQFPFLFNSIFLFILLSSSFIPLLFPISNRSRITEENNKPYKNRMIVVCIFISPLFNCARLKKGTKKNWRKIKITARVWIHRNQRIRTIIIALSSFKWWRSLYNASNNHLFHRMYYGA